MDPRGKGKSLPHRAHCAEVRLPTVPRHLYKDQESTDNTPKICLQTHDITRAKIAQSSQTGIDQRTIARVWLVFNATHTSHSEG